MITNGMLIAPERLARVAYERLYESINTRRLIAFVGSGVSLVYGQPTWTDFVRRLVGTLESDLAEVKASRRGTAAGERTLDDSTMGYLAGRIRNLMSAAQAADPRHTLVVLELVRRAFDELDRIAPMEAGKRYHLALTRLFDFNGIAPVLLAERLANVPGATWGLEAPVVYTFDFLTALSKVTLKQPAMKRLIRRRTETILQLEALTESLRQEPDRYGERVGNRPLPLDRRSLLSVYLAVASRLRIDLSALTAGIKRAEPDARPLLDPLYELDEWLHVRRYLTTNYDLTLEDLHMPSTEAMSVSHLASRRDLTKFPECWSLVRQLPDGRVIRSETVDRRHVMPLVEFALGSVDNAVHIYHHHGRIDQPETLIVADGEYNRLYRAEGGLRTSFDHAYDALIAGNPILFVGSGMNEEELNRTLRASVSNPDVLRSAPAIVLRAATTDTRRMVMEEVALATQLGANVIHYGGAERGARYCLPDHVGLLDAIARAYRLTIVEDGAGKLWRSDGTMIDLTLGDPSIVDLDERFRLLRDLDFDRHVVAWLMHDQRPLFQVQGAKGAKGGTVASAPQRLLANYLRMLSQKLVTAALRHELRQVGHEAARFYAHKSTMIPPRRALPARMEERDDLLVRHVSSRRAGEGRTKRLILLDDDGMLRSDRRVDAVSLDQVVETDRALGRPLRTVVLGERGAGKGGLLTEYVEGAGGHGRRRLVVNCCYGQEVDSIVTMIEQFVEPGSVEREKADPRSRRRRILDYIRLPPKGGARPLVVLAGVDRLFGTDEQVLAVEFEWLLNLLIEPTSEIDLLVTGSLRCRRFFASRQADELIRFWLVEPWNEEGERVSGLLAKLTKALETREPEHYRHAALASDWRQRQEMSHGALKIDLVVGQALAALERWGEPFATGVSGKRGKAVPGAGALAVDLVRALAFIGLPVTASVLLSVPSVRASVAALGGRKLRLQDEGAREPFLEALAKAVAMGLVSIIEPAGGGATELIAVPEDGELKAVREACGKRHRFVVHRLVNQVIRDRFGVPNSEIVLSDSYNLSLYTVQPDDAAVPEKRVVHELEKLSDYLMNSWKDVDLVLKRPCGRDFDVKSFISLTRRMLLRNDAYYSHPLSLFYLDRLKALRRRLALSSLLALDGLRAAAGVIRGYYSAVNLFALDVDDPRSRKEDGGIAAITGHKLRIRQLLDLAIEAGRVRDDDDEDGPFYFYSRPDAKGALTRILHEVACIETDLGAKGERGRRQTLKPSWVSVRTEDRVFAARRAAWCGALREGDGPTATQDPAPRAVGVPW